MRCKVQIWGLLLLFMFIYMKLKKKKKKRVIAKSSWLAELPLMT